MQCLCRLNCITATRCLAAPCPTPPPPPPCPSAGDWNQTKYYLLSHGPRINGSVEPCWYSSYYENITCNTCHVSRICQLPSMEPHNTLISPCRCLGSIRYVHNPCLAVSDSPQPPATAYLIILSWTIYCRNGWKFAQERLGSLLCASFVSISTYGIRSLWWVDIKYLNSFAADNGNGIKYYNIQ